MKLLKPKSGLNPHIYLDNNATTVVDPRVVNILLKELEGAPSNPSSVHYFGQKSKQLLIDAVEEIASIFKVKPQEIVFTSGATEGLNSLIRGFCKCEKYPHIISATTEHPAVYQTLKKIEAQGAQVTFLEPIKGTATISLDQIKHALKPNTQLIVLMAANNETGEISDIQSIGDWAHDQGIPFIVDGVSLLGKEEFNISKGIAGICFSGHKIHAPKGIGLTIIRKEYKYEPLILGGPQQYGKRAGTENMAFILGLVKAISLLKDELASSSSHMRRLRDRLEQGIIAQLSDVLINGDQPRVCNTSNLAFLGVDGENLLFNLDREGIAVSHGSACMSGTLELSRILFQMGYSKQRVQGSIRFSLSKFTTLEEIDQCIDKVVQLVKIQRAHSLKPNLLPL